MEQILSGHRIVIGPAEEASLASRVHSVIYRSKAEKQVSTLVKLDGTLVLGDPWSVHAPSLEDIVLGYLQRGNVGPDDLPGKAKKEVRA